MNPNQCTVVLRPRSPFEVFDLVLLYLRANHRALLRLWALVILPPWVMLSLVCWWVEGHWAVLFLVPVVLPLLQGPFTALGGHLLFDDDLGALAALRRGWSPQVLLAGLGSAVLGSLFVLFTCGFGAALWFPATLFVPESLLLERVPLARALKRARVLAAGHPVAALVGVFSRPWLTLWGAVVAEFGGQLILANGLQLGAPFGSAMQLQVTPFVLFGILAMQPLHALYRLLLYIDVRTRVEGWDLQVAFRSAVLERQR